MNRTPALIPAIAIIIGIFAALYDFHALLFLFILFDRKFIQTLVFAAAALLTTMHRVELPEHDFAGEGKFSIYTISESHDAWIYRGYWYPNGRSIPVSVTIPDQGNRPLAHCDWWIRGNLEVTPYNNYKLRINPDQPWIAIPYSFNLSEWRFAAKNRVKNWIETVIKDPQSALFLTGIVTGTFEDYAMKAQFSRFGLQHIMAISGFHFTLIAFLLGLMIRPLLGMRKTGAALMTLLTAYFIFLGCAPSVMRAWGSLLVVLAGQHMGRVASGLNALAIATILLLLWDPLLLHTIGFCFSCVTTASILMFHSAIASKLEFLVPARRLSESLQLTMLDQHGYCLASFLRQLLALTFSVNCVAIPVTLYYFGYFPLMSVIYNLFFPFFVTVSMTLLFLSIPLPFLHGVNSAWTRFTLDFTTQMPQSIDVGVSVDAFSPWLLGAILALLWLIYRNFVQHERLGIEVRKGFIKKYFKFWMAASAN